MKLGALAVLCGACTGGGTAAPDAGAVAATLTISPATADFGYSRMQNTKAVPIEFTISTDIDVAGFAYILDQHDTGNPFTVPATTCGATLAADAPCTVTIGFTDDDEGEYKATLTAQATGATDAPAMLIARGGFSPPGLQVDLNGGAQDFGELPVLGTKTFDMTITNIWVAPLGPFVAGFDAMGYPGDYAVVTDGCGGKTLAVGQSCDATIAFTPQEIGGSNSKVTFTADWAEVELDLRGYGDPTSQLAIAPATVDLGYIDPAGKTATFTVSNTGAVAASKVALTTANGVLAGTTCTETLAPGASCTATVTLSPTTTGPVGGGLTAKSANAIHADASYTGTAINASDLVLDSYTAAVGPVALGDSAHHILTVTNVGTDARSVTATVDGLWTIASNGCATVGPGTSCPIEVVVTPTKADTANGTLTLTASGASVTAKLTAYGAVGQNQVVVTPTHTDFGHVIVGQTLTQTITITAQGDAAEPPLEIDFNAHDAALANDHCSGVALAPGASCTLDVVVTPSQPTFWDASVLITGWNVTSAYLDAYPDPAP